MKKIIFLFISILLVSYSCKNEHSHSQEEDIHDHSEELTRKFTIYTDKTELFVEFPSLIKGEISKFTAHFTYLSDFKPVLKGKLTVSLVQGKKGIRHSVDSPIRPGIFQPALKPKEAGKYKLIFDLKTAEFTDRIVIPDITVYPDNKTAHTELDKKGQDEGILFFKEQAWEIEFANKLITKHKFHKVIKATGEILQAQGDEIIIPAKHSGLIIFNKENLLEGQKILSGQLLFTISTQGLTHDNFETDFKEIKAIFEKSQIDFERAFKLNKEKIISDKDFQEIKLTYENNKNRYLLMKNNYFGGGQKITATKGGYIKKVYITEGQYVDIGQPVISIAQNKRLIIKAEVSQKYFSDLPNIFSANFRTPYNSKTYNIEELNGKIISYGKNSEKSSFYTPVFFEIDNKGDIIPGSYVEVFIKTNSISETITIPISSIIEEHGNYFVFIQTGGETFEKRTIELGINDGKEIQVLSGIHEGERVVTKGAYRIKLASLSTELQDVHAGHSH